MIPHGQHLATVALSLVTLLAPLPCRAVLSADDVEEIQNAVRGAIQQCCVQLKAKIAKQQAAREQRQRKRNLLRYIPNVAAAVYSVLKGIADRTSAAGPSAFSSLLMRHCPSP